MNKDLQDSMSDSMETHRKMLPYLHLLLKDMWALGSSPEKIIEMVRPLALPADSTRVLDLGCGKGAVCIQLAKNFGFRVVGVDGSAPFLEEARIKAQENSVESQCQFVEQDIREYVKTARNFDVVVLASLGGVFGPYDETVKFLRDTIRNGGFIIIDDGFSKRDVHQRRSGYLHYLPHKKTLNQLTSQGDELVDEIILSDEENSAIDREYIETLKTRSIPLLEQHPELKELVNHYIENQLEECDYIEDNLVGAIWLLQKKQSEINLLTLRILPCMN